MPYVCVSDWGTNGDGVLMQVYPVQSVRNGYLNRKLPACVGPLSGGDPGAIAAGLNDAGGRAHVVASCGDCKHDNAVVGNAAVAASVKAAVLHAFSGVASAIEDALLAAAERLPEPARKVAAKRKAARKKVAAKKATARRGEGSKAAARKGTAKKATAKRPTAKKGTVRKAVGTRRTAEKATAKKTGESGPTAKKTIARKASTKRPTAKKGTAKRASTKRPTVKKATARKTAGR
ncbi:histone H1-like repetitive region-containing protein [Pyxidicoccus fallax]|uniref:Histone H1-like repetitive region-containing protein n=1 Tax=Pyxidicoccus fallax TaxID=394095 RepID=A0A848LUP8_9BACT|nr:histone H1-like repetitive region-containing protein [Pyxidicoccus fallax]NMO21203.1 histone H1-like repetitive region-containing protein [Pyxidicoccus fallax]NPC82302.1 histone H1-like repetitive region-containing protein [Pyxidicoccus fallax]